MDNVKPDSNQTAGTIPSQNAAIGTQTVEASPGLPGLISPDLIQTLMQQGSPIVVLLLLVWLFKVLTVFVKACREN